MERVPTSQKPYKIGPRARSVFVQDFLTKATAQGLGRPYRRSFGGQRTSKSKFSCLTTPTAKPCRDRRMVFHGKRPCCAASTTAASLRSTAPGWEWRDVSKNLVRSNPPCGGKRLVDSRGRIFQRHHSFLCRFNHFLYVTTRKTHLGLQLTTRSRQTGPGDKQRYSSSPRCPDNRAGRQVAAPTAWPRST